MISLLLHFRSKLEAHSNKAKSGHDLHLPPEISTQILTNLPVKSLVRFRSVSKTWYSLISSPNFISDHTAQTLNRSSGHRVLLHFLKTGSNYSFLDESFAESPDHPDVPELIRLLNVKIVGSCDGLICFCTWGKFLIWNPSIRKLVELPIYRSRPLVHISGFGFDWESRDYKVVRVMFPTDEISDRYEISDRVVAESEIWDLRKGVWRSSRSSLSSPMRLPCLVSHPSVYFYGNLHWVGSDETSTNYALVSFDLSSEVLHVMEMVLDGDCIESHPKLFRMNGLLSVAMRKKNPQGDAQQYFCSVWSMKEYGVSESWTKLFNIELPPCTVNLFWCLEDGEVLLGEQAGSYMDVKVVTLYKDVTNVLALYNPESRKSTNLFSAKGRIWDACFYQESLILL